MADVDGRCPACLLAVDGRSVEASPRDPRVEASRLNRRLEAARRRPRFAASPRNRRAEASPRNQRDGVDTLGEVLLVVKGTFAIIALVYLVVSCGG
ncbi:MAG TPA: hypothetical protein VEQ60_16455 [Longimicrobium sp.]|nr:hypothetical protein [Longimicrobium sp.]